MLEQVQSWNKEAQSGTGMLRCGTEMMDAKTTVLRLDADAQLCILGSHICIWSCFKVKSRISYPLH